jgi:hypothetical protein
LDVKLVSVAEVIDDAIERERKALSKAVDAMGIPRRVVPIRRQQPRTGGHLWFGEEPLQILQTWGVASTYLEETSGLCVLSVGQ